MTKALELAKFGRESAPAGAVVGDSDTQTLSAKTFSDGPVFSAGIVDGVAYLNGSKALTTSSNLTFNGTLLTVSDLRDSSLTTGRITYAGTAGNLVDSAALTFDGNALTLGGSAPLLRSNMSGGQSTRFGIQNSTVNGNTRFYLYPNGTGTISAINLWNNSDPNAANYSALDVAIIGSQDARFSSNASGTGAVLPFTWYLGASEQMRLNSTGLGIGIASPDRPVHLSSSGNRNYFKAETTTNSLSNEAGFEVKTPNSSFLIGSHGSTNALWIYDMNAAAERLRITSAGNLGIGTATPAAKLTVVGSTLFNGTALGLGEASPSYGGISFGFDGGPNLAQIIAVNASTSSLGFYTKAAGAAPQERMRIDAAGNVGIGTTSPSATLTVAGSLRVENSSTGSFGLQAVGNAGAARDIFLAGQSGYSNGFTVRYNGTSMRYTFQDGIVGINKTDPVTQLDIATTGAVISGTATIGTNMAGIRVHNSISATPNNAIGLWLATGPHQAGIAAFRADPNTDWGTTLAFYTHGPETTGLDNCSERVRIDGRGRLGIGTTNPTETLHVSGNIIADTAYLANGNARLHFYTYQIGEAYSYAHLKTNIPWENHTQMYSVEITGHEYGASKPINAQLVWYSYSPNAGVVSVGSSGTHIMEVYRSTDGYLVIRVSLPSGYYTAFTVSQYTTNQGLGRITILGSAGHNSSNFY